MRWREKHGIVSRYSYCRRNACECNKLFDCVAIALVSMENFQPKKQTNNNNTNQYGNGHEQRKSERSPWIDLMKHESWPCNAIITIIHSNSSGFKESFKEFGLRRGKWQQHLRIQKKKNRKNPLDERYLFSRFIKWELFYDMHNSKIDTDDKYQMQTSK